MSNLSMIRVLIVRDSEHYYQAPHSLSHMIHYFDQVDNDKDALCWQQFLYIFGLLYNNLVAHQKSYYTTPIINITPKHRNTNCPH